MDSGFLAAKHSLHTTLGGIAYRVVKLAQMNATAFFLTIHVKYWRTAKLLREFWNDDDTPSKIFPL